jgi:hypothetical protein
MPCYFYGLLLLLLLLRELLMHLHQLRQGRLWWVWRGISTFQPRQPSFSSPTLTFAS